MFKRCPSAKIHRKARFIALSLILTCAFLFVLITPLSVSAADLQIVQPNGGEILVIGKEYTIQWTPTNRHNNFQINLSLDGGATYGIMLTLAMPYTFGAENGWVTITVPNEPTKTARIRVTEWGINTPERTAESVKDFSIVKAGDLLNLIPKPIDLTPIDPIVINPIPIDTDLFRPPAAPEDLEVVSISADEISLAWTDTSAREEGFTIERKAGGGTFSKIGQTTADITSFTDANVTSGTAYTYRIQAYNAFGTSNYSNEVTAQNQDVVMPPLPQLPIPVFPLPEPSAPAGETIVMHFYIDNTDYFINGALSTMDAAPTIFEGRTVLPIKYVAEPLGAAVGWDPGPRRVRITHQNRIVDLWIGVNRAEINGAGQQIDANNPGVTPVILPPGRTMLPLRFIAEQLGARVEWDQVQRRVTITYPAP